MTTLGNLAITENGANVGGVELPLTDFESKVLQCLADAGGAIVSPAELHAALYGEKPGPAPESNVLQVFVGRLRHKLSRAGARVAIATARGKGYSIAEIPPLAEPVAG